MTRNPQIKAARASGAVLICGFLVISRGLPRQVAFTSADKLAVFSVRLRISVPSL
jgi:hypothetical protein